MNIEEPSKETSAKIAGRIGGANWRRASSAWKFLKPGAIAFATLGAYMAGAIYYEEYLGRFYIDYRTFPVDTPRTYVYGGYALFRLISALPAINRVFLVLGGIIVVYAMVAAAALFSPAENKRAGWSERFGAWLRSLYKVPPRLTASVKAGSVAAAVVQALLLLFYLALFLLIIPVSIGQSGAQAAFEEESKNYAGGCEHPSGGSLCAKLYDQDKLLAEGFVIVASPDQVALYRNGTTTILDLKGRRLVTEGQAVPKNGQLLQKPSTSTAH